MTTLSFSNQERTEAINEMLRTNPLAAEQVKSIMFARRIAAQEAELAELRDGQHARDVAAVTNGAKEILGSVVDARTSPSPE